MEDRLQKFAVLVDSGSYTAAAKKLHISQPALTAAIQKLEHELKAELLIRGNRRLHATPAGEHAYKAGKDIAEAGRGLRSRIAEDAGRPGRLAIGLIDSLADQLFVRGDGEQHLGGAVTLVIDNSSRLQEYVANGSLDIAMLAKSRHWPPQLKARDLGAEQFYLVVHPAGATEAQSRLDAGVMSSFISYNPASHTYALIRDYFLANNIDVTDSSSSTSPHIIAEFAATGRGIAALPATTVEPYLASGRLARLHEPVPLVRRICAVYREGRYVSHRAQQAMTMVENLLA